MVFEDAKRAAEKLTGTLPVPADEPETIVWTQGWKEFKALSNPDDSNSPVIFWYSLLSDPTQVISQYHFKCLKYDKQIYALKEFHKKPLEQKKIAYEKGIAGIETHIAKRKEEYKQLEIRALESQDIYESLQAEYNQGLGTLFQPGDQQERALKQAMTQAAMTIPGLPSKKVYVYSGNSVDMDDPARISKFYPDIRSLERIYDNRLDFTEKQISDIDYKIDCNVAQLETANTEYHQFEKWRKQQ